MNESIEEFISKKCSGNYVREIVADYNMHKSDEFHTKRIVIRSIGQAGDKYDCFVGMVKTVDGVHRWLDLNAYQ